MGWSDVKDVVGKVAPLAGTLLAGPAGGAVGGLLASALGVEASPQAVSQAVQSDPEAALKVRQVEARLEATLIESRASVIQAEAKGESWLQRNWRPLVMLWFASLVGAHWLGFTPDNLSGGHVDQMLQIVQYGLTGYIVSRGAEKITRTVTGTGLLDRITKR